MDLRAYLLEVVRPTIAEFEANPTSRRHAFIACVVTYHCVDYLAYPDKPQNRLASFREACPGFEVVDRVAHAFKHVKTGHSENPHRQPLASGDVISRPPAVWGEAVWDLSRWDDETGGVTIDGERELDLLVAIREAVEFLERQALSAPGHRV